jgi:hypothetical protein
MQNKQKEALTHDTKESVSFTFVLAMDCLYVWRLYEYGGLRIHTLFIFTVPGLQTKNFI